MNRQVKCNRYRFPRKLMFQLTAESKTEVVANRDRLSGLTFSKKPPYTFTEIGAMVAASVLNTPRAVEVRVFIVRAFVKLKESILRHKELAQHVAKLGIRMANHDQQVLFLARATKQLIGPESLPKKRRIGFRNE